LAFGPVKSGVGKSGDWRRAHGGVARDQFAKQVVGREGRPLGREFLVGARLRGLALLRGSSGLPRKGCGLFKPPFDAVSAREHFRDVLPGYLGFELGVRNRLRAGHPVLHGQDSEKYYITEKPNSPDHPPAATIWWLLLGKSFGAPRTQLVILIGTPLVVTRTQFMLRFHREHVLLRASAGRT